MSSAGQLEQELEWDAGRHGGSRVPEGFLGSLVGAIVGMGSGHRESWEQAAEPGALAEVCVVCGKSQGSVKLGQELWVVRCKFWGRAVPGLPWHTGWTLYLGQASGAGQ